MEAFRWFYYLALLPSLWYTLDLSVHYTFMLLEWWVDVAMIAA